MPRKTAPRTAEDWIDELMRLRRMSAAAQIDLRHGEEWKRATVALLEALQVLVAASPDGEALALEQAHARFSGSQPTKRSA